MAETNEGINEDAAKQIANAAYEKFKDTTVTIEELQDLLNLNL